MRKIRNIALTFLLFGCLGWLAADAIAKGKPREKVKIPDLIHVDENDKEMNEAIKKAQKSVDAFIKAYAKPSEEQAGFSIKVGIRDGEKTEHFWVKIKSFEESHFVGTIDNEPKMIKTVEYGDPIKVDKAKISDWMYIDKKKLVGGYTIRLLRSRMTEEERKALDEAVPFKIE